MVGIIPQEIMVLLPLEWGTKLAGENKSHPPMLEADTKLYIKRVLFLTPGVGICFLLDPPN